LRTTTTGFSGKIKRSTKTRRKIEISVREEKKESKVEELA